VSAVRDAGRRDLPVDLVRDGGRWTLDLEALDAAAADATALVWVSPHNPTGRAFDEAEVAAVAEIAARHALVVLSDEIWADVLLGATVHVPFARVARDVDVALAERTVTMVGTSKAFNVAQVGAAVTHGGSAVFDRLRGRGRLGLAPPAGRVEQAVATEAWRNGRTWLDGTLATLTAARDAAAPVLVDAFGADRVTLPDATYLAWVDVRGTALEGLDPGRVAAACGIVPTAGADYEAPGFVRLNLGCDPATAAELAGRLAAGARG
jgi:cystathionine beta-lyase